MSGKNCARTRISPTFAKTFNLPSKKTLTALTVIYLLGKFVWEMLLGGVGVAGDNILRFFRMGLGGPASDKNREMSLFHGFLL